MTPESQSFCERWTDAGGATAFGLTRAVTRTVAKGLISGREFFILSRQRTRDDGSVFSSAVGVVDRRHTPNSKLVLARCNPCCMVLTPLPGGGCRVVDVTHANLGGWLPTSLVNATTVSVLKEVYKDLKRHAAAAL